MRVMKRQVKRPLLRKKSYKKKASIKPSKALTKAVKSIIHKQTETKSAYAQTFTSTFNAPISVAGDVIQIVPNLTNGTLDSNRIGDQIRAQSLKIKGFIASNLSFTSLTGCRLGVRLMIVQPKQYGDLGAIQAFASTWLTYLLKKGGSVVPFAGNIPDLFADINTDAITKYYDKVFYINTPYLQTAVGDTSTFNSVKFFQHTMKLKNKLLKYDSNVNAGVTPVTFNPVMFVGYVKLDGSAVDANVQISLSNDCYLYYEDA